MMMDDERLKAKRNMYDEIEQWARGKSMDKFRPKAVVEKETAVIRGDEEDEGQPNGEEPMVAELEAEEPMGDEIDLEELIQALTKRG